MAAVPAFSMPGQEALAAMAASGATARAVAAVARAITIAVAAMTGDGFLFTAQQGDADDREKDRDTE